MDKIQFDKILGYIDIGKQQGARLATGGERIGDKVRISDTLPSITLRRASSSSPRSLPTSRLRCLSTIARVIGQQDSMKICSEEIFGPVMSVIKFTSEDEVPCIHLPRAAAHMPSGAAASQQHAVRARRGSVHARLGSRALIIVHGMPR